jgi:hypothetical protein
MADQDLARAALTRAWSVYADQRAWTGTTNDALRLNALFVSVAKRAPRTLNC